MESFEGRDSNNSDCEESYDKSYERNGHSDEYDEEGGNEHDMGEGSDRAYERDMGDMGDTGECGTDRDCESDDDAAGYLSALGSPRPSFASPRKHKRKYESTSSSGDEGKEGKEENLSKRFKNEAEPRLSFGQSRQNNGFVKYATDRPVVQGTGKNVAENIMKRMGFQQGQGLGKHGQGRTEPVQAAKQHGYRGLGLRLPELENASIKWDPEEEEVTVKEEMEWIMNDDSPAPSREELARWLVTGPSKDTIDDEVTFCSPGTVRDVVKSKAVFDKLDKVEMRRARTRSNPFETIRGAFFLNRAAVKMANIDKACDFLFTKPKNLRSNELLYFADVCAGPGGFSEYVLWRKKWRAKGFGFTLKNQNDFKLDDFYAGHCETFHPYYGPKEDGDVFDPINQDAFHELIMKHTNGVGVHFMMSDGGFSVEGQENIQEILSKQLYLCQCLVALRIVRVGGHFVTKLFDLFTPFSAGLVYLMYRSFDQVSIFKPNTSRPANSERYLICKGKRRDTEDVAAYLRDINGLLLKRTKSNDVVQIVPFKEMEMEGRFLEYLRRSNDYLGRKQTTGLLKIAAYCEDTSLVEVRQADMRRECLKYWELPDVSRTAPSRDKPQDRLRSILPNVQLDFLSKDPQRLTPHNIGNILTNAPFNWFCVPCTSGNQTEEDKRATFYMSMGRSKVYRYIGGSWREVKESLTMKLELPPDTLVYAEIVVEIRKEGRSQRRRSALHIIDAYMLDREDISQYYVETRHELIKLFCDALWKPRAGDYLRVRAKELHTVDYDLDGKLKLIRRPMKTGPDLLTYEFAQTVFDDDDDDDKSRDVHFPLYFVPNSVLFLKSIRYPWSRHFSKSHNRTYVFNRNSGEAFFEPERPREAEAPFLDSFASRIVWHWPNDEVLPMEAIMQQIREKCPRVRKPS